MCVVKRHRCCKAEVETIRTIRSGFDQYIRFSSSISINQSSHESAPTEPKWARRSQLRECTAREQMFQLGIETAVTSPWKAVRRTASGDCFEDSSHLHFDLLLATRPPPRPPNRRAVPASNLDTRPCTSATIDAYHVGSFRRIREVGIQYVPVLRIPYLQSDPICYQSAVNDMREQNCLTTAGCVFFTSTAVSTGQGCAATRWRFLQSGCRFRSGSLTLHTCSSTGV